MHLVINIFHRYFKDGICTDNQHIDYRSFSALYVLLRILFASVFISIVLNIRKMLLDHSWTISRHHGRVFSYAKAVQEKMDES